MGHRQLLQVAVWAVCLASTGGAFAEPPPGSEAPTEYGEAEVETVVVIGNNYRCPDGTIVAALAECPAFQVFWWDTFFFVTLSSDGIIPKYQSDASACGSTPDANCACGSREVKVYDDGNDTFHCKPEPPTKCPKWDQTFDFDPEVWKCLARPLDATAQAAANRIKACFSTASTIHKFWNNVQRFEYGTGCPPGKLACVISCSNGGANNVVQFNEAELNNVRLDNSGNPIDATEWQWFAEALNHELRHVRHNAKYDCGRDPSNPSAPRWGPNSNFWSGERVPLWFPTTPQGEEEWTAASSLREFAAELGVVSPFDAAYTPAKHKQLPNCQLL